VSQSSKERVLPASSSMRARPERASLELYQYQSHSFAKLERRQWPSEQLAEAIGDVKYLPTRHIQRIVAGDRSLGEYEVAWGVG
jgi:hypothetical protein